MPDSDESLRQHMQEETAQELACVQRHFALFAAMGIILPAENAAENHDRQKKRITGAYPAGVVRRDPSRRDNAMNMRMQEKVLSPCVQNTDRADLRTEVPGIGCDFQ